MKYGDKVTMLKQYGIIAEGSKGVFVQAGEEKGTSVVEMGRSQYEVPTEYLSLQKIEQEYTGGIVSYYAAKIEHPTIPRDPYTAECNDIIEALHMTFAEGNAFKAIWRSCAARLGTSKKGYTDGMYDAEKVVFFGQRMVEAAKNAKP